MTITTSGIAPLYFRFVTLIEDYCDNGFNDAVQERKHLILMYVSGGIMRLLRFERR